MVTKIEKSIFKKGSTTYYFSSLFFPKDIRDDIFTLYAFVRTFDDFVDMLPQKKDEFLHLKKIALLMLNKNSKFSQDFYPKKYQIKKSTNLDIPYYYYEIVKRYISLTERKKFNPEWTLNFIASMESDLYKKTYKTWKELNTYIHGSAEVIGLMISRIMNLPKKADIYAQCLGKAMQLINFIRDIQQDLKLGRQYLPVDMLKTYKLNSLAYTEVSKKKESFILLMRKLIEIYYQIQKRAEEGYVYIPKIYRIAIKTAADMYAYTAQKIYTNPLIVYEQQIKPSPFRIIITGLKNAI